MVNGELRIMNAMHPASELIIDCELGLFRKIIAVFFMIFFFITLVVFDYNHIS